MEKKYFERNYCLGQTLKINPGYGSSIKITNQPFENPSVPCELLFLGRCKINPCISHCPVRIVEVLTSIHSAFKVGPFAP